MIFIHKNDSTIFADQDKFLTFHINTDKDLTGWKAEFVLCSVKKAIDNISAKTFEVILSAKDTSKLWIGKPYGELRLIDAKGNIKTIANKIPFCVTTDIVENEEQTIDLDIPESADISVSVSYENIINYEELKNKPSINGVELQGNKSLDELGVQPKGEYLTEHQDISHLATKQEVEEGLESKQPKGEYLTEHQDISHLATKQEVEEGLESKQPKGNYLTEHQDISHLATKEELENAVGNIDFTDLYTKTETNELLNTKQDVFTSSNPLELTSKTFTNQNKLKYEDGVVTITGDYYSRRVISQSSLGYDTVHNVKAWLYYYKLGATSSTPSDDFYTVKRDGLLNYISYPFKFKAGETIYFPLNYILGYFGEDDIFNSVVMGFEGLKMSSTSKRYYVTISDSPNGNKWVDTVETFAVRTLYGANITPIENTLTPSFLGYSLYCDSLEVGSNLTTTFYYKTKAENAQTKVTKTLVLTQDMVDALSKIDIAIGTVWTGYGTTTSYEQAPIKDGNDNILFNTDSGSYTTNLLQLKYDNETLKVVDGKLTADVDALPDQTDNGGKFLQTDGENASWQHALVNNSEISQALAIGENAKAESFASNAIGSNAVVESEYSIAMGYGAWATSDRDDGQNIMNKYSVAIGANSTVTKPNSISVVSDGGVYSSQSIAMGYGAVARTADSIAIGSNSSTGTDIPSESVKNAIAIGTNTKAYQEGAVSLGNKAQAYGANTIVIGSNAITNNDASNSIAIGNSAISAGSGSVVIGNNAKSNSPNGANVVVGNNAKATGYVTNSTAIGPSATANAYEATAVGYNAKSGTDYSLAIGFQAQTNANNFGEPTNGRAEGNIAIGLQAESTSNDSIAIGDYSVANGKYSVALGADAKAKENNSIAIGKQAQAQLTSIAIGNEANSIVSNGIAIGTSAQNTDAFGIAIGPTSEAARVGIGIGVNAKSKADGAIQIGEGNNFYANTLKVFNHLLLNAEGVIPYGRLTNINSPEHGQALVYDEHEDALCWSAAGGGIAEVNWGDINGDLSDQEDLNDKFMDIRSNFQDVNEAIQSLEMDFSTSTRKLENEIQDTEDKLQAQINDLSAIGQFLAIWDCDTHNARYLTEGYEYQAGNYFIIGSIATDGVNYMPNGNTYPGYVETTEDVKVSDMFFFDGEHWIYLANHERAIAIDAELDVNSINPVENKAVATAIEELQNRPTGVGVPQLASVDVAQIKTPDEAEERRLNYTDHMGLYSDIVVTLNLDKQDILDKMYDLYVTVSRFKANKNLTYQFDSGDGEQDQNYRNIPKFCVLNDLRQKTDARLYCWRFVTDTGYGEHNPQRYCYFYTQQNYADGDALREADPRIGLWYNSDSPSGIGTCFNAIGWFNHGYYAEMYYQDYYGEDSGIERYEEGDIDSFVNLRDSNFGSYNPSDYCTKMQCRKYTKDGQNYFFWCADWEDAASETYCLTDDNDNVIPNGIPTHMDELTYVFNVFDLPYEFVEKRSDLNYKSVTDFDMLLESLEELTFQGRGVGDNKPIEWKCYWFDYPVMPILLKDCEVRKHESDGTDRWIKLDDLVRNGETDKLNDDLPLELKLPYNTYYLWMRLLAIQKRCTYGSPTDWREEEGREISNPMWPSQKNSLMEGIWNGIISKAGFGAKHGYRSGSGYGKICEYIEFNLCEAKNVAHHNKTKATPIQKRLYLTHTGKSGLRN